VLVYGDHREEVAVAARLATLAQDNGRWLAHERLRDRFIALAGVAQGVADADFEAHGADRFRAGEERLLDELLAHARALMRSWDAGCEGAVAPEIIGHADLPERVIVKEAEGYAFYALYPETYGLAARQLKLRAPPRVIGLRSIGTGLAAMATAALGAERPITLRPSGDPFARALRIDDALADALLRGEPHYVIVDEGPGLSGSSFGAVADWLEEHGVARNRIAFLPSHSADLGLHASSAHRERWQKAQRPVATMDRLPAWVAAQIGPIERWTDLSGGVWRPLWSAAERDWPAVIPSWERAKFLVRAGGAEWMVRFAGLGGVAERKLDLAQLLHREGFGPEPLGITHGWLIQRWHSDAQPTRPNLDELTAYLRLRSSLDAEPGASLSTLVAMARRNVSELATWSPDTDGLARHVRPVRIDGKLQPHEWLRLPTGRLLKADALDHHVGHDLIGCQDLAWDVAGAALELRLGKHDATELERNLGAEPALTAFYRIAYLAFRLGVHGLGEQMSPAEEQPRHRAAAENYRSALIDAVEHLRDVDQTLGRGIEAFA